MTHLEAFKKSLEEISDEEFKKILDELESEPHDKNEMTVGEFMDLMKRQLGNEENEQQQQLSSIQ